MEHLSPVLVFVNDGFQSSSVGDDGWNAQIFCCFPHSLCFNPHPSEMTDGTVFHRRRSQPAACFNPHPSEMTDGTDAVKDLVAATNMFQSSSVGDDGWNNIYAFN